MGNILKDWMSKGEADTTYNAVIRHKEDFLWNILKRNYQDNSPHWRRADMLEKIYNAIQFEALQDGLPLPSCAIFNVKITHENDTPGELVKDVSGPYQCQTHAYERWEYWSFNLGNIKK